jgi:hypothetical protein
MLAECGAQDVQIGIGPLAQEGREGEDPAHVRQ